MSKGWIKLHRELQDHWLWESTKKFTKAQAWIDLLLRVNHKSKKVMIDNELIKCNSGETITSETKLAERWGWSRTKVRSFIDLLESDNMIEKHTKNKRYTKLSVCNYSTYQKNDTKEKQQKNNSETTEKQQKNINKNDNNVKNEKNYTKWVEFWNDVNDAQCRITDKKRKQIRQRLNTYSEKELKTAIRNRAKDDWINGEGSKFKTDWNSFWRNDEKPERYLNVESNDDSDLFDNNKMRKINAGN